MSYPQQPGQAPDHRYHPGQPPYQQSPGPPQYQQQFPGPPPYQQQFQQNSDWQPYQQLPGHQDPGWQQPGYQHPVAANRNAHPGWAARILFWSALIIGHVPILVMMPILHSRPVPTVFEFYSIVTYGVAGVKVLLLVVAMLVVKGTTWPRRAIGAGLLFLISLYGLVVPRLIAQLLMSTSADISSTIRIQGHLGAVHLVVMLTGTLIAWNVVRNRAWWTHLVAAGIAVIAAGLMTLFQLVPRWIQTPVSLPLILGDLCVLGLTFAGLGLLHLLGAGAGTGTGVGAGRASRA